MCLYALNIQVPFEARRGRPIPWNWIYTWFLSHVMWEPNACSLEEEQYVLLTALTAEPSLQSTRFVFET